MKLKDAYGQKIDAQIEELAARLALFRAKANQLAADGKIAAYEELADTEEKLAALKQRLAALNAASAGAWQDMKGGVDKAWGDLSASAKRAFKRFG